MGLLLHRLQSSEEAYQNCLCHCSAGRGSRYRWYAYITVSLYTLLTLAGFFYSLDRNLEDVDGFYNRKFAEVLRRLKLLQDQYGKSLDDPTDINRDEVEDLFGVLLGWRDMLRKLQWYGEVNRRGFVKITKKLDKKLPNHDQRRYIETKVDVKPFATNTALLDLITKSSDWMSKLEIRPIEDSSSTHSSLSLPRVSSKAMWNIPKETLDKIDQAIRADDPSTLSTLVEAINIVGNDRPEDPIYQSLQLNLLQRAISCRSERCIADLLRNITSLEELDDMNQRNCLHRYVVSLSRTLQADEDEDLPRSSISASTNDGNYITPATAPVLSVPSRSKKEIDGVKKLGIDDKSVQLLIYILDHLKKWQRYALRATDSAGRMPLHYAAQHGFVVIVQVIISRMQEWEQFEMAHEIDAPFWQDSEGWSPLQLSVTGGHTKTTQALLEAEEWRGEQDSAAVRRHIGRAGEVLALATKLNFVQIVKLLVEAKVDLNYKDRQGETALHVAARFGHSDCAKLLLTGSAGQKPNIEIRENTYGWTPLFIASVDGQKAIVELLIDAGAELNRVDGSGWTAQEHACLRGYLDIARMLAARTPQKQSHLDSASSSHSLSDRKSAANVSRLPQNSDTLKTFGHKYLTNETMVLVSLGTMDMRKNIDAVTLDRIPLADAHLTQLDTALSVIVSASGAEGEPCTIDLPVQENISTDPIVFMTKDATKVKLLFDIVPTYSGSKDAKVGRGVALLSSIKPNIGSKRITLQGDLSVPVISSRNLEVIGTVNFNFLIITPFQHANMSITENQTYWKKMESTMIIGHRGLGKNQASRLSLQLGENTIPSFITAANLGASYVEFDVQLTKDLVPVIYHDFLVSETGIDAPVHTMTLEQFLHAGDTKTSRASRPVSPMVTDPSIENIKMIESRKQRSMSLGTNGPNKEEMDERMKHTRDFKKKGFKANTRGDFIKAPFTTLEQMFTQIPESVGFNIEMKYPMLHESEEQEMDTYAVELNSFVDTVLTKVYDLAKQRNVIFSSFNPDICLLLSFKQPSIPVLFLTDAGTTAVGDIRASSLQEGIRFASRWNLLGVVCAAEPLVLSPRLVKVVKESGLVCVSYGTLNNDPATVGVQVREGIDAVIVDSVLAIRKGLQGTDPGASITSPEFTQAQGKAPAVLVSDGIPGTSNNEISGNKGSQGA